MTQDDLPLFTWNPPTQILVFPMTKRIGKIRHTAELLSQKTGADADLYIKQVKASGRKHLKRMELTDEEVENEISAFFDAVDNEVNRLIYQPARPDSIR